MEDSEPAGDPRKYIQLAAALRGMITDRTLMPGQPAPSITRIAADRSWARGTCRHALQILQDEGLLTIVPGLGYYVAVRLPGAAGSKADDAG
jgi:DNA-binding GntR family transcriptional regulator